MYKISAGLISIVILSSYNGHSMDDDSGFKLLEDKEDANCKLITSIAVHPLQHQLAYGFKCGEEHFYRVKKPKEEIQGTLGLSTTSNSSSLVDFSLKGNKFVAGGGSSLQLSMNGQNAEKRFLSTVIEALQFSGNGKYLFMLANSMGQEHELYVYDVSACKKDLFSSLQTYSLSSLKPQFSRVLATSSVKKTINNQTSDVERVLYSSDCHNLIISSFDGDTLVYDNSLYRESSIMDVKFNRLGTLLAVICKSGVQLVNPKNCSVVYDLPVVNDIPCTTAFSSNYFLFGSQKGKVVSIDLESLQNVSWPVGIYTAGSSVKKLSSNQDGSLIAWTNEESFFESSLKDMHEFSAMCTMSHDYSLDLDPEMHMKNERRKKCKKRLKCAALMAPLCFLAATCMYYGLQPIIEYH